MVQADPVSELEHAVARTICEAASRTTGCAPTDVHVHFRESTIVYVLDCDGMPRPESDAAGALHRAVADALQRTLGRALVETTSCQWLSESSVLVMLRLL